MDAGILQLLSSSYGYLKQFLYKTSDEAIKYCKKKGSFKVVMERELPEVWELL